MLNGDRSLNSSFDEYSTEVKSGRLEWSPVHTSEKFWVENTPRLNEKNYELLKYVKKIIFFLVYTFVHVRNDFIRKMILFVFNFDLKFE